ncbi:hypothetical protein IAR50_006664 [Cryptococcus sp. DSM 104548]
MRWTLHKLLDGHLQLQRNDFILVELVTKLLSDMEADATIPDDVLDDLRERGRSLPRDFNTASKCGRGRTSKFKTFIMSALFNYLNDVGQTKSLFVGEQESREFVTPDEYYNGVADILCGSTGVELKAGGTELCWGQLK